MAASGKPLQWDGRSPESQSGPPSLAAPLREYQVSRSGRARPRSARLQAIPKRKRRACGPTQVQRGKSCCLQTGSATDRSHINLLVAHRQASSKAKLGHAARASFRAAESKGDEKTPRLRVEGASFPKRGKHFRLAHPSPHQSGGSGIPGHCRAPPGWTLRKSGSDLTAPPNTPGVRRSSEPGRSHSESANDMAGVCLLPPTRESRRHTKKSHLFFPVHTQSKPTRVCSAAESKGENF